MKINKIAFLLTITLVLVSNSFITALSQEKKNSDQDTIKLRSELVQIDVLVTDKNNKPVGGLKREDFELYDNGKPQLITNFSYEEAKNLRIEGNKEAGQTASLPQAITAGELHRVVAFVIDTLHMNPSSMYSTRKMLQDFIDHQMKPGDLVLIISTGSGSGLLQQFTADRRLLSQAINRLRPFYLTEALPPLLEAANVRETLQRLKDVVKAMSKLPGRKITMFISQGFNPYSTETTIDLARTTALAARANVVFYSIDPAGLVVDGINAADGFDLNDQRSIADPENTLGVISTSRINRREAQATLREIALETGGKFFGNNNDIIKGLNNLLDENSQYYMLGFQPDSKRWDGKFHKIKVVVRDRPDLTVTSRKGYLAESEKPDARPRFDPKIADVMEAITSPLVRRDIDLKLTPFYIDGPKGEAVVNITLHIDVSRFTFREVEDKHQAVLEQVGYIFDVNGKPVDQFANDLHLDLRQQTYEASLKQGLVVTRKLNLKPGLYQVKLFVRNKESGLIGTANDLFEVPNMKADRLATSSIFTSGQPVEQGKTGEGSTLAHRSFNRSSDLAYSMVIYNAQTEGKSNQPQLEMRLRVLNGAKVVFSGPPRAVEAGAGSAPPARIVAGGGLQLRALAPGDYTLELTVIDKLRKKDSNRIARQEIDFSVQ
ncbi:MAG TPA: VWA domain-containing protein [Blastocatellia bacterium]|nr:VWA domain-containing protein [Blastocatellia bacterium]